MLSVDFDSCTGCHACYSICPKNCIKMEPNVEGFLYPVIDKSTCIDCGLCEKACPLLSDLKTNNKNEAFASYNLDENIVKQSSSGGIFSAIATDVIAKGGVVFGAALSNEFKVEHICVDNILDLSRLYGSKYIQSELGDAFKLAKSLLKQNRLVYFSGTPCQIAGLRSFLYKDYNNLITQDIICMGVPSSTIFEKFLDSVLDGKHAESVQFRNKDNGWMNYQMVIKSEDDAYKFIHSENKYMKLFSTGVPIRYSCFNCRCKGVNRLSDITLADFWGVNNIKPDLYNENGTSLVMIHTDRGRETIDNISAKIKLFSIDLEDAIKENPMAIQSIKVDFQKKEWYQKNISNKTFDEIFDECYVPSVANVSKKQTMFRKLKYILKRVVGNINE